MQVISAKFLNFSEVNLFSFNKNSDLYEFFTIFLYVNIVLLFFLPNVPFSIIHVIKNFHVLFRIFFGINHTTDSESSRTENPGGGMSCSFGPAQKLDSLNWCCCNSCVTLAKCKKGDLYARPPVSEICAYRTMLFCCLYFCITQ